METVGARYTAGVACLLGCIYNGDKRPSPDEAKDCERKCNEQFMSLGSPVLPKDALLYSSSFRH